MLLATCLSLAPLWGAGPDDPAPDFDQDVAPILSELCFDCHGPDQAARQANLRLDQREGALAVAVPGSAKDSELMRRVQAQASHLRMPPPETGEAITAAQVATLSAWIDGGLTYAPHWAFVPPEPAAVPTFAAPVGDWIRNPIDAFVLERLQKQGLAPAPEPSPAKLLRRVHLDLTGLPPTIEQLDAFLADPSDSAYDAVVEELLASPRHAEHVTREWLDGARYADTNGYQNDFARHQWPWRDWVLASFQRNQPYDQFMLEQVAGDLLPDATTDQVLGTGFQRNHRTVTEAGSLDEEWRVENVVDRVETTATVFLGLTMGCARCHDHKYDPVSQAEFFGLYACFNSIDEQGVYTETRGNVAPILEVPGPNDHAELDGLDRDIAAAELALAAAAEGQAAAFERWLEGLAPSEPSSQASPVPAPLLTAPLALYPEESQGAQIPGLDPGVLDPRSQVDFESDQPFTFALWVRATNTGAVYAKMADDDSYQGLDLVLLGDRRAASHLIHDWPEDALKVVTEEPLPAEVWLHLAVSYDGSRRAAGLQIYVNGELAPTRVEADSLTGSVRTEAPLTLGTRRYAGELQGRLSDFVVFDKALPAEAIAQVRDRRGQRLRDAMPAAEARLSLEALFADVYSPELVQARGGLQALRKAREERAQSIPTAMVLAERDEPRPTFVLDRGRYDAPLKDRPVEPQVPAVLGALPDNDEPRRLALGRWLCDPANPLPARVQVNRVWQRFFGRGLVASQENFGVQGSRPSHPELLDWLATEFVAKGWDQRALERWIVSSSTYRQGSALARSAYESDPHNDRLARGARMRLDAEAIRDSALYAAGLLVERVGGPPTRPYQPAGLWTELAGGAGQGAYVQDQGEDLWRRSLYTHRKRTVPHPTLASLDAPSFEICQVRRARTNTPLQALALLNDTTYVEAARALAQRLTLAHPGNVREQIRLGFRLCTSRVPTGQELDVLQAGYDRRIASFRQDPASAEALLAHGDSPLDEDLARPELAALATTAAILLNLDETLTKE